MATQKQMNGGEPARKKQQSQQKPAEGAPREDAKTGSDQMQGSTPPKDITDWAAF